MPNHVEILGEITEVLVKKSDPNQWCLVHDGERVILLAKPGRETSTGVNRTMLVGPRADLQDVIRDLDLDWPGGG